MQALQPVRHRPKRRKPTSLRDAATARSGPRIFNQTVDTWYFGGGFRGKFGRTAIASSTEPLQPCAETVVVDCAVCGSRSQELISVIVVCEWLERCGGRCSKWRSCRLLGCPSKPRCRIPSRSGLEDQVGHCDVMRPEGTKRAQRITHQAQQSQVSLPPARPVE